MYVNTVVMVGIKGTTLLISCTVDGLHVFTIVVMLVCMAVLNPPPPQDGTNESACQVLRNLCSLDVFLESSLACRDVPSVYYTEPGDLLLTQNSVTSQFVTRGSTVCEACLCTTHSTQVHTLEYTHTPAVCA